MREDDTSCWFLLRYSRSVATPTVLAPPLDSTGVAARGWPCAPNRQLAAAPDSVEEGGSSGGRLLSASTLQQVLCRLVSKQPPQQGLAS